MNFEIQPKYQTIAVTCSCGYETTVGSTRENALHIEVCAKCHPFYTGKQKVGSSDGRIAKFKDRYRTSRDKE